MKPFYNKKSKRILKKTIPKTADYKQQPSPKSLTKNAKIIKSSSSKKKKEKSKKNESQNKNYNDENMKEHLIFDWKIQVVTLSSFPPFALPRYPVNRATEKDKGYL